MGKAVFRKEPVGAFADREHRGRIVLRRRPNRNPGKKRGHTPSTITISAVAYFCRIAFAAWYSGEL